MKNILKRLNIFAVLIAIVSNVFVVTPIADEHVHKWAYDVEVHSYQIQDENNHRHYTVWESRCSCGAELGITDKIITVESHLWNGDTCSQCGYINRHIHKGVTRGNKVTIFMFCDEATHTYRTVYEELCSCGESIGFIDDTITTTEHNFKNDKCTECGYTKSHTHKGVTKGKAVTSLKSYDETTHTYVTAYENLCSCGESVGFIDETTNTANHSFKDDKCTECGYITKNPAKDEQSILGDFFEDANVDGIAAQITVGEIPDSGLVVEVSSLLANKNIVGANLPELVPLIGSLKYSDEVYTVVKNADDLENIIENANGFYEIAHAVVIRKDEA